VGQVVPLDLLVLMVQPGPEAQLEREEILVIQETLGQQALLAQQDQLGQVEKEDQVDQVDHQDRVAQVDLGEHLVLQELLAWQVQVEGQVLQAHLDQLVKLGPLDHLVNEDNLVI